MGKFFLEKSKAVLVIVDVQEKLAAVMKDKQKVVSNCLHLIETAKLLEVPIIVTEQYPRGLGPTVKEIKDALSSHEPVEKMAFNSCKEPAFVDKLAAIGKKKVILCGMETHICVLQTCLSLISAGYSVHLVRDAVCSRTEENWITGVELMRNAGAVVTCTETALFQLLEVAGTTEFKIISQRIK